MVFVVPQNLITARVGGHAVYCSTAGPVAALVTNLLLREEEIDLQLNQEEEREV